MEVLIRELQPSEHALVYANWIESALDFNKLHWKHWHEVHKGLFPVGDRILAAGLHDQIERLLTVPGSVHVACFSDDPDVIIGFVVATGEVLHWLFVKAKFRRNGVARALLESASLPPRLVVSSVTPCWSSFARHLKLDWLFNPYSINP